MLTRSWIRSLFAHPATRPMCYVQRRARLALEVVEDRCVKIEHGRFFGGLGWAGVNTRVISAKRAGSHSG